MSVSLTAPVVLLAVGAHWKASVVTMSPTWPQRSVPPFLIWACVAAAGLLTGDRGASGRRGGRASWLRRRRVAGRGARSAGRQERRAANGENQPQRGTSTDCDLNA